MCIVYVCITPMYNLIFRRLTIYRIEVYFNKIEKIIKYIFFQSTLTLMTALFHMGADNLQSSMYIPWRISLCCFKR